MKAHVIISNVNACERRKLERIESYVFKSYLDVQKALTDINVDLGQTEILDLSEFVDSVNDQENDVLTNSWITYVFINP